MQLLQTIMPFSIKLTTKRFVLCILLLGAVFAFSGEVNAQNLSPNDCANFMNVDANTFPQSFEQSRSNLDANMLAVFTDKDLSVAAKNLQAYCCSSGNAGTASCENVDVPNKRIFTESPFFADHLIYVGMKKFDGIQEHCDELGIDCQPRELNLDPVARREEIKKIGEDIKGYPPSMIQDKFTQYWKVHDEGDPIFDGSTFPNAFNYMCNDLKNVVSIMADSSGLGGVATPTGETIGDGCIALTRQRYNREYNYIQTLMVEKGRKYMIDNLKSYLNKYFIDNRLSGLMGKYTDLDACFRNVLRKIDKTSCCNT